MNKILLIIQREYLSRVKKKSFIYMTILGPLLIAGMYAAAIWLAINGNELAEAKTVTVIDQSGIFASKLSNSRSLKYSSSTAAISDAKAGFATSGVDYLLYIPNDSLSPGKGVELYSEEQPSMSVTTSISDDLETILENRKLMNAGIDKKMLDSLKADISLNTIQLTAEGEKDSNTAAAFGISMFAGIIIYISILIYGVQVMRGVIEEKTNRIVEVIISSVKPFQLMLGKIIGIAMVGITQFVMWIVLTVTISTFVTPMLVSDDAKNQMEQMQKIGKQPGGMNNSSATLKILQAVNTLDFPLIIGCFLFYYIGGYLLYSALFAAIGSAVDSETETQQFMLPVTLPLIFAFILSTSFVINNPSSPLSFWLSVIPFTSPIVMMVRIPFGVPVWQLAVSMATLAAGFIFTVWLAARIYRTGILMYGNKTSFREIVKWLFYKG